MNAFIAKHQGQILGVLSGFDHQQASLWGP
jgi:hypothetical protein